VVQSPSPQQALRLGRNANGYLGETIDITEVLGDCAAAAKVHGWDIHEIPAGSNLTLLAFTRAGERHALHQTAADSGSIPASRRVYVSAGIHGDEPAGPLAVRELLRQDAWPPGLDLCVLPCLNPSGFRLNRRENAEGLDLNRQYLLPVAWETRAHIAWLEQQLPFDLCLCLHEDWESHGFYLYELNPENQPSLAESIIARVKELCPIDRSETIEGRPARNGVIRPSVDPATRPKWPESFFLLTHKTRLSYTLEAPSDFPLPARVAALALSVKTALKVFSTHPT